MNGEFETSHALSFENVSKAYDAGVGMRYALRGVSFVVEPARKVAVVGRSGSGKSTLLHLAAGIDVPTGGMVKVGDRDLSALTEEARSKLRRDEVGLIFQFFYLMPHLPVADNVALPAMIAGEKPRSYRPRVMELLERVELGDRAGDPVQKLSGGEQQRVAICRALLRRPGLLLADEPTGNLDDDNGRRVMALMMELVDHEGATLVYVTHSREFAALADEVWELHSGELSLPSPPRAPA
ncbi:MAG: ABC transporter ATP-binding protein [Gemmatimonadota bacterium]|nr:ABC transporter ATP-binding protein [Gemmatimonadota bacterium]